MSDEHTIAGVEIPEENASFTADAESALAGAVASNATMATLEANAQAAANGIGTEFWVEKVLTSSAILQAGVAVTLASSGGDLELLDVIASTDTTGLAGGTNFELSVNNAFGLAVPFAEAVANLGASKTVNLDTASVTKQRIVLESGKVITAKSTVADCTGAGQVKLYLRFRRLAAAATVAAA